MRKEIIRFIDQIKEGINKKNLKYDAGIVCKHDDKYIIGYSMCGAEELFSIGQPIYDENNFLMGYLGINLFHNLDYDAQIRIPCECWEICMPTKYCIDGKQIYTYWHQQEKCNDR